MDSSDTSQNMDKRKTVEVSDIQRQQNFQLLICDNLTCARKNTDVLHYGYGFVKRHIASKPIIGLYIVCCVFWFIFPNEKVFYEI